MTVAEARPIRRASAGRAFGRLAEPFRRELKLHCSALCTEPRSGQEPVPVGLRRRQAKLAHGAPRQRDERADRVPPCVPLPPRRHGGFVALLKEEATFIRRVRSHGRGAGLGRHALQVLESRRDLGLSGRDLDNEGVSGLTVFVRPPGLRLFPAFGLPLTLPDAARPDSLLHVCAEVAPVFSSLLLR